MKHLIVIAILINWFFAFRVPTEDRPGVFFTMVKGPYVEELDCWEDHDIMKDLILAFVEEEEIVETGCVGDATEKVKLWRQS